MGHLHCEYFLCLRLGNRCLPELLRVLRSFEGDPARSTILPDYWVGCSVTSRSGWRAPGSSNSSNAPIFGSRPGSHCSCPGVLVPARVNGFCSFPLRRSRSRGCRRQGGAAPPGGPRMAGNGARRHPTSGRALRRGDAIGRCRISKIASRFRGVGQYFEAPLSGPGFPRTGPQSDGGNPLQ